MDSDQLNFYLTQWGTSNLGPFRAYIRNASKAELSDLGLRIRAHEKEHEQRRQTVSRSLRERSSHFMALAAVNWEIRKRSRTRLWLHNTLFPIRKWWSGFWSGSDLVQTVDYGSQAIKRKRGKSLFYSYGFRRWILKIILVPVLQYLGRNANWLVPTIVGALVAIYVAKGYGN